MLASALASLNGGADRRRGTLPRWVLPAVALFAVLVLVVVSTHPHSGQSAPPMFGDYEAQRHWMELTLHTPLAQWYTHTTLNDLQYWGLDYPPLTAFQSWLCGVLMRSVEPASVALTTSRGWESYRSKLAMRFTVIVSDLLFTLPAVHLFVRAFYGREKGGNGARNAWATALILLAPGPILIYHGHFQYNNWSLGLTTYAVAAILHGKHVCGSVLFTLSLCHKQMSLYHAPAFFAHLIGRCLRCVYFNSRMGNMTDDVVFDSIYLFTDPNDRRWRLPSWPPPFSARCPSSSRRFTSRTPGVSTASRRCSRGSRRSNAGSSR